MATINSSQLINSTTNQNVSLLGIIGMFCPFRVQLLLQLPPPRIILVSLSAKSVLELLHNACNNRLTWPKHVWILHSYQLEDFKQQADTSCTCTLSLALENVLLFREDFRVCPDYTHHNTTFTQGGSMMPYGQHLQK